MDPSKPDWYSRLQQRPFEKRNFTVKQMQAVEGKLRGAEAKKKRAYRRFLTLGLSIAALLLFVVMLPQTRSWMNERIEGPEPPNQVVSPSPTPSPTATVTPTPTASPGSGEPYHFDPAKVRVGDSIGGMRVASIKEGTHGSNSYSITFSATSEPKELSGTFRYTSEHFFFEAYNPNQILFTPAPPSAKKLPYTNSKPFPPAVVLQISPGELSKFGEPGRSGTATVRISEYTIVTGDILEGTTERMLVSAVVQSKLDDPPPLAEMKEELSESLRPLEQLKLSGGKTPSAADAQSVYPWLQAMNGTYNASISALGERIGEKTVAPSVKAAMQGWLEAVLTEEKARGKLEAMYFPLLGGYQFMYSILDLFPPGPIKAAEQPALTLQDENTMLFTVKVIMASGTRDFKLTVTLVRSKDGAWVIRDTGYTPI
ncbi:hypothetical protein [Paenibacillus koleovorans]|uniref:hypothetical protein n=1 Tax=Paenibacillus koleovorans TaxID=121608 RepID=UPI000FD8AD45|nr:hypothetical protein [Paenibacillus koleovorans]